MMNFWNTNALALAILGATIGFLLIEMLDSNEKVNVLGNFLVGVGCILLIAGSQQESLDKCNEQNLTDEVNQLKKRLIELEKKM